MQFSLQVASSETIGYALVSPSSVECRNGLEIYVHGFRYDSTTWPFSNTRKIMELVITYKGILFIRIYFLLLSLANLAKCEAFHYISTSRTGTTVLQNTGLSNGEFSEPFLNSALV
jgi:hypothetical protein